MRGNQFSGYFTIRQKKLSIWLRRSAYAVNGKIKKNTEEIDMYTYKVAPYLLPNIDAKSQQQEG